MIAREGVLSTVAAILLAGSIFTSFAYPVAGLALSASALTIAIFLRHRGGLREGNAPLVGALLIGGGGITALAGVFLVLFTVNRYAPFYLFAALLIPPFGFLLVFGARERLRAIFRNLDRMAGSDDKPGT